MLVRPEEWHEFFLTVGTGAAALTGLVVVALSMHLDVITEDPTLLHRARMILVGLSTAFIRCSLALMGGLDARGVAVALFVVCLGVNGLSVASYRPVKHLHERHRSSFRRTLLGFVCYTLEMLGAGLLFCGVGWGLTLAAVAMMVNFGLMISGAWLLLLGVRRDEEEGR